METVRHIWILTALALCCLVGVDPALARCTGEPTIGDAALGIKAFPSVTPERIVVQYDDRCTDEAYTKIVYRQGSIAPWQTLQLDRGAVDGWRLAVLTDFNPEEDVCFQVSAQLNDLIGSVATCLAAPGAEPAPSPGPVAAGLISEVQDTCSDPQYVPNSVALKEHLFLSRPLAEELKLVAPTDTPAEIDQKIRWDAPSPQVRVIVDSPLMAGGLTSTTAYSVVRICDVPERKVWFWNLDRLYFDTPDAELVGQLELTVHDDAPSYSTVDGVSNTDYHNFDEPAGQGADRYLEERVFISPDKQVLLMIPHGGRIEARTSEQIPSFTEAMEEGGQVEINLWEMDGRWSGQANRWHITSPDIHPEGYPGLQKLLDQPGDVPSGRPFRYAVAFHGYGRDEDDFGILLGGRAPADLRCWVAASILAEAGDRAAEIGFRIPRPGDSDLVLESPARSYAPGDHNDLEGTSADNIVNRAADGGDVQDPDNWGSIQLEQSTCIRSEWEADCVGTQAPGCSLATVASPECMHNIVARGVAKALRDVLVDGLDPTGACSLLP